MYKLILILILTAKFGYAMNNQTDKNDEHIPPTRVYLDTRACLTDISNELYLITYIKNTSVFDIQHDFNFTGLQNVLYASHRGTYKVYNKEVEVDPIILIGHSEYLPDISSKQSFNQGESYIGFLNLSKNYGIKVDDKLNLKIDFNLTLIVDWEKNILAFAIIDEIKYNKECHFNIPKFPIKK